MATFSFKILTFISLNSLWIPVSFQGIQYSMATSWIALFSIFGYAICALSSYGCWHALISVEIHVEWIERAKIFAICLILFLGGIGLVAIGTFTELSLDGHRIYLVPSSALLDFMEILSNRWQKSAINHLN